MILLAKSSGARPILGRELTSLRSGTIIGGFPEARYTTGKHTLLPGSRLYIYSDGMHELGLADGTTLPLEEFIAELGKPAKASKLDKILAWATAIRTGSGFEDDVSILELIVP